MRLTNHGSCPLAITGIAGGVSLPPTYWLSHSDPVVYALSDYLYSTGPSPIEDLVCDSQSPATERPYGVDLCVNKVIRLLDNPLDDSMHYGSILGGLKAFASFLGFVPADHYQSGNEKGAYHVQTLGKATPTAFPTWIDPSASRGLKPDYFDWISVPANSTPTGVPVDRVRKVGHLPNQYEILGDNYYGYTPVSFSVIVNYLTEMCGGRHEWQAIVDDSYQWSTTQWGFFHMTTVKDFTALSLPDGSYEIGYHIEYVLSHSRVRLTLDPEYTWTFSNRLRFTPTSQAPVDDRSPLTIGDIVAIAPRSWLLSMEFVSTCIAAGGTDAPFQPIGRYMANSPYNNYNVPAVQSVTSSQHTYDSCRFMSYILGFGVSDEFFTRLQTRIRKDDHEHAFARLVDDSMDDIRASSFVSTSDALEQLTTKVDSNLIEALYELPEFFAVLPDFRRLVELAQSVRKGVSVWTAFELIKWLANEDLRLVFGTIPNVGLIMQTLPDLIRAITRLRNLEPTPLIGRGSMSFDFPDGTFGRSKVRLVTRTKAIFNSRPTGALADCLALKSLGLLPSASSLWDIVPLSFVLDWAVDVQDRFRDVENMALVSAMSLRAMVHSYTITSPCQGDYSQYGVVEEPEQPLCFRYYRREVSRYVAPPRSSRFDFRWPTRPPNMLTAGSLFTTRV